MLKNKEEIKANQGNKYLQLNNTHGKNATNQEQNSKQLQAMVNWGKVNKKKISASSTNKPVQR